MNFKKVALAFTAFAAVAVLAGCEEEASKTTHAVNINSTEETVQESPKKGIDRDHTITIQGQEIQLETSYKVDERNLNDYVFTTPSIADLSVKLKTDAPQNYNIRVTNLYADVSVSSKYSRFNGLRQDSINLNLTQAPNGGYDITTMDDYMQPFQIESVNQNESFIHGWGGYVSEHYSYLTEREIKRNSNGAVLRTVWTLSIEDTQTHKTYSKTISDTIFMPSHGEE